MPTFDNYEPNRDVFTTESPYDRTDRGNAEHFAHEFGDRLRYDHLRKRWLVWEGNYWMPDKGPFVMQMIYAFAKTEFLGATMREKNPQGPFTKHWQVTNSYPHLQAILKSAKDYPPVADLGEDWDMNPNLLGVLNGVVEFDPETGDHHFRPGRPEDNITRRCKVNYNPEAKSPIWDKFVHDIQPDPEVREYTRLAWGYTLTGHYREQCLHVAYGPSAANGKSTTFNAIFDIMGDYAANVGVEVFLKDRNTKSTLEIAEMRDKRFVKATEPEKKTSFDAGKIKMLTGGEAVSGRHLYKGNETFVPTAKIWISANHKPTVHDDTDGFWRRMRLIMYPCHYTEPDNPDHDPRYVRDGKLGEKLQNEYEGILMWLINAASDWYRQGIEHPPAAVALLVQEYKEENDTLEQFFAEMCYVHPDLRIETALLYNAYKEWGHRQGMSDREIGSANGFARNMPIKYKTKERRNYKALYAGIALRPKQGDNEEEPEPDTFTWGDEPDAR